MDLKGLAGHFFWKRRWKVDGSICAPICWAVLVENLSEHCRCPFTMSASTPREQGPQGSLLGTAPLFQDPKYLKKTVTCFKLTDSLLSHRSFGHNSQFWLFFRASAMCSAHLINGCSLSYWLITLLLGTTNQEGKKARQTCIIRSSNSAFRKILWLLCCTAPRAHKTLRNPV